MKLNLNQITIPVQNVEESIEFYKKLGLKLIVRALPKYARFECMAGDTTFSLHKADTVVQPINPIIIYFESEYLDKDVTKLMALGLVFDEMPTDQPWLWREARLRDIDNHLIILYQPGINRKKPPWRLATED
ncbi:MAG: VOC family protein [Saprospiraceae bacterium]